MLLPLANRINVHGIDNLIERNQVEGLVLFLRFVEGEGFGAQHGPEQGPAADVAVLGFEQAQVAVVYYAVRVAEGVLGGGAEIRRGARWAGAGGACAGAGDGGGVVYGVCAGGRGG